MGWLDLHMHSHYSVDGQYTPEELILRCIKNGVRTAAIADHNTTQGIPQAQRLAFLHGLTLIPAIELDSLYQDINLHILGYWVDPAYEEFARIGQKIHEQDLQMSEKRVSLIQGLGIQVDIEKAREIALGGAIVGETIAEVALGDPANDKNPLLAPYRPGGARADNPYVNFYWDFCAQGKPAYIFSPYISLQEAIDHIRAAGGIAILAHPGVYSNEDADFLRDIASHGLSGLEVFSSYHTPEQTDFYKSQAEQMGLAMTCGSDFHGKTKPSIEIGSVSCDGRESELLAALDEKRKEVSSG